MKNWEGSTKVMEPYHGNITLSLTSEDRQHEACDFVVLPCGM